MNTKNTLIAIVALFATTATFAQVGIGTIAPHATAALDVESTTKGFLPPRMTDAQRDAIASPADGLTIFNTTEKCLQWYNNTVWYSGCARTSLYADCASTGFVGSMFNTLENANDSTGVYYKVTITNNSSASVTKPVAASDLVLSGDFAGQSVSTVSATAAGVAITSVTLAVGASTTVFYRIAGTPTTTGTITGTWTIGGLTCTKTATVNPKPSFVAALNTTTAVTRSFNGAWADVDIVSSNFTSNSNPNLLAGSLFNANGIFVAPYTGTYTFKYKTWTRTLISGTNSWQFAAIVNGVFPPNFPFNHATVSPTQVTNTYTILAGQTIELRHRSCSGCTSLTTVDFGNLAFEVSY